VASNDIVSNPDPAVDGANIGAGFVAFFYMVAGIFGGSFGAGLLVPDWRAPFIAVILWSFCHPFPLLLLTDNYDSGIFVSVLPLLGVGLIGAGVGIGLRRLALTIYRKSGSADA
jgi:hypothetical protein